MIVGWLLIGIIIIQMEQDSEIAVSTIPTENQPEPEALQNIIQRDEREMIPISEQLRVKFSETVTRFAQHMKSFQEGQKNLFVLENPHEYELVHIVKLWRTRPIKNQRFLLTLELQNIKIPLEVVRNIFEFAPSILVYYAKERIENNGVLLTDGEFFYEGSEKLMYIFSQTRQTEYEGEVMNRQMHGRGILTCRAKQSAYVYKGTFFEGKYHGTGELRNNKNVVYLGEFKNDFKHGHGMEMTLKRKKNPTKGESGLVKKSTYNGEFVEGYRCGEGVEDTQHGVYKGNWKDNVKCGKGEMTYKNGDRYEGEWQNNQFSGEGTYEEKGNCTYKGSFLQGKYHGEGTMQYQNGDKYTGQFQKGKKHGQGIYTWADGDYYDGEWKHDSAEGTGTSMIGTDFYDGEFKNGRRHGVGELTTEDGDVIKAIWMNNEMTKELQRNGQPVE